MLSERERDRGGRNLKAAGEEQVKTSSNTPLNDAEQPMALVEEGQWIYCYKDRGGKIQWNGNYKSISEQYFTQKLKNEFREIICSYFKVAKRFHF